MVGLPTPLLRQQAAIAASSTRVCMLSREGEIVCFATEPTVRPSARPAERVASDERFVAFAVSGSHTCVIGADALAYCTPAAFYSPSSGSPGLAGYS